jgi:hypothetical protein
MDDHKRLPPPFSTWHIYLPKCPDCCDTTMKKRKWKPRLSEIHHDIIHSFLWKLECDCWSVMPCCPDVVCGEFLQICEKMVLKEGGVKMFVRNHLSIFDQLQKLFNVIPSWRSCRFQKDSNDDILIYCASLRIQTDVVTWFDPHTYVFHISMKKKLVKWLERYHIPKIIVLHMCTFLQFE